MAIQQQPPAGGLNQVARPAAPAAPAAPAQPPKQENLAARAAGMEQEGVDSPQDYFTKTIEERRKQSEALMAQIEKLRNSRDSRMGLPFDPVLMAGAAGFLKPTKTGSFGESLGYAAEGMSTEADKEFARRQAIAKLDLELAEKGLSAMTKNLEMEDLLRMSGMGGKALPAPRVGAPTGAPSGAPTGAAPVSGAPTAGGAPAAGTVGQTGAPNQMPRLTDADITRAYAISKEHGDRIAAIAKMQREDVRDIGGRPYSTSRQEFLTGDPNKPVEYDFGRFVGTKKTDAGTVEEYKRVRKEALEKNDPEIEFNWFKRQGWLGGTIKPTKEEIAGGKAPTTGAEKDEPILTVEERAAREAARKKRTEVEIEEEKTQVSNLRNNMQNARNLTNIAKDMTTYASSNPRAFQLLQGFDQPVREAIFRAAEKGIQAGQFGSISLPTRELESYKLSVQDREALQMFMQKYAELTVNFRKVARAPGEGATTESEGLLFSQLGALPTDTARVIILKSHALELKAEYDRQLFRAWNNYRKKNPDDSYADFLGSDVKNTLDDQYDATLQKVRERNSDLFGGKKPAESRPSSPAAPAAPAAPANRPPASAAPAAPTAGPVRIRNKADEAFKKLPVGGMYIDVDGTVKRKKEGE